MTNIKLDFDTDNFSEVEKTIVEKSFVLIETGIDIKKCIVLRTRRGYHVVIAISDNVQLDNIDVLTIQTLLGDDNKRSVFNYERVKLGISTWNILFTKYERYLPRESKLLTRTLKRELKKHRVRR